MFRRQYQHIRPCISHIINKIVITELKIGMAFNGKLCVLSYPSDNLRPSHKLAVRHIEHVARIGMYVVCPCLFSFSDLFSEPSVICKGKPCCYLYSLAIHWLSSMSRWMFRYSVPGRTYLPPLIISVAVPSACTAVTESRLLYGMVMSLWVEV